MKSLKSYRAGLNTTPMEIPRPESPQERERARAQLSKTFQDIVVEIVADEIRKRESVVTEKHGNDSNGSRTSKERKRV